MSKTPHVVRPWYNASNQNDGSCVDVQFLSDGSVMLRHSKNPEGETLTYDAAEWAAFTRGVMDGKFSPAV